MLKIMDYGMNSRVTARSGCTCYCTCTCQGFETFGAASSSSLHMASGDSVIPKKQ